MPLLTTNIMSPRIRKLRVFDWSAVDSRLTRQLLITVYESKGESDEVAKLRKLSYTGLASQARKVFKSSLKNSRYLDISIRVLVVQWLPKAPAEIIERLTTWVQAGVIGSSRNKSMSTKSERVEFLKSRRHTRNFKINVARAFEQAHRVEREIVVQPPGSREELLPHLLKGMEEPPPFTAYAHQTEARKNLDKLLKRNNLPSGVLVLPTGSGKTDTLVAWLLPRMHEDPSLRVLWIAHQQQLLDQAMDHFDRIARNLPIGFQKCGRIIHAEAADIAVLADPNTDVALVTFQSLAVNFAKNRKKQRYLQKFFENPTIVIVDEAHHAAAPSYDKVLEAIADNPNTRAIIGLTATPWPTSLRAKAVFQRRFPEEIINVTVEELISNGILARPVLQTIATGQQVRLSEREAQQAEAQDLPSSVLHHLETSHRNRVIVEAYAQRQDRWGKTLVFANSIDHADELGEQLSTHAPTRVLHSRVRESRRVILDWFKQHKGPCVLVSVGMLTEGVDLPDASTAFLARPTTSRILMRQMIGRVLRGPQAGGKTEANLVFFRDIWTNFFDVLEPPEVLPQLTLTRPDSRQGEISLPPVLDDAGDAVDPDVLAATGRQMASSIARDGLNGTDEIAPIDPLLIPSRLIGYYRIRDEVIPVFEHQNSGFEGLLEYAQVKQGKRGPAILSFFDDSHPPYPSRRALQSLVEFVREFEEPPPFFNLEATIGPDIVAKSVLDAGAITDEDREKLIRERFDRSVNRVVYPSFERFEEAVEQRIRQLRRLRGGEPSRFEAEVPLPESVRRRKLPRYDRDLEPIRRRAMERADEILPKHLKNMLEQYQPPIEWTKRVARSTWAHWSIDLQGRRRGQQVIRVNRVLRTTHEAVPDELIAYLIYHELLHSLLPGQGHDAEFRELESLWVGSARLDSEFATMHERWNLDPKHYDG